MPLPANSVPVFGYNEESEATGLSFDADGNLKTSGGSAGKIETPTREVVTEDGTVAAGATTVTILSSADFVGTVLGAVFSASQSETFPSHPGNTLAAIAYTITAGSLTITKQVAA